MQQVKIVDYYSQHTFHEVVNSSLIEICASLFRKVTYVSGKSAQNNMKRLLSSKTELSTKIDYQTIPTCDADTSWGARIRDVWGFFTTIFQYLITPYRTLLFYNYTNKFSLPIILTLNILLKKRIVFLFHGELEFLIRNVSYLKTSGWYKKSMQISFRNMFTLSPAYVLVLGNSIRMNLLKLYPRLGAHVLSIYHPYIIDNKLFTIKGTNNIPLKIGTVGVMNKLKGLDSLIELSSRLYDLIQQKKLEFYCIGKVNASDVYLVDRVQWVGHENGLSRAEFETHIKGLDYILYLYPTDSYKFTASGAIMDALKMHKPILSLHNDFFDQLIGNHPIGYMGNAVEDLEQIIRQIVQGELTTDFTEGFKTLSDKISIENNVSLLRKEFEKVNL